MATLTVTARRQIYLSKDVLRHLGIQPGETVELEKLPGGQVALRAKRKQGTIDDFIGMLAGKTTKVATLRDLQHAVREGWAGLR